MSAVNRNSPSDPSSSSENTPLRKRDVAKQTFKKLFEKRPQSKETISRTSSKAEQVFFTPSKEGVRKSIKGILSKAASRASNIFSKSVLVEPLPPASDVPDAPLYVGETKSPKTDEKNTPKEFGKFIKRNNALINDLYQEVHRLRAAGDEDSLAKASALKEKINDLSYENQVHFSHMKGIKPPTREEYFAPPKSLTPPPRDEDPDDDYIVVPHS